MTFGYKMLCWRLARFSLQKNGPISNLSRQSVISRNISTSKKNSDATATTAQAKPNPKWQSYGFALTEHEDRAHMHISFFLGITVTFVFCGFYIAYCPNERNWEQREAFLELRRREQEGLPLVDQNYVDPGLIVLPSEEELEGLEVII